MKKIIITIIGIIMMISMVSCSQTETRDTVRHVEENDNIVYVIEQVSKNDKVIEEKKYYIVFETAEEAWTEVYGSSN